MKESEILLYSTPEGGVRIDVLYQDESVWLTQKRLAELFEVDVRTISAHLKNVFRSGELSEESVIRKFRITAADGKKYLTNFSWKSDFDRLVEASDQSKTEEK